MLMTKAEVDFFWQEMHEAKHRAYGKCAVLEWGSGSSTIEIGQFAAVTVSIEHDNEWFKKVAEWCKDWILHGRLQLVLAEAKPPYDDIKDGDGSYEQFKNYIEWPLYRHNLYDLILVDGRARVECCKIAAQCLNPGGIILLHDLDKKDPKRSGYFDILKDFALIKQVETLAKISPIL